MIIALPVVAPDAGDVVMYRGCWGEDAPTRATVLGIGEKNGEPIASLDDGHWCYFHQIDGICSDEDPDSFDFCQGCGLHPDFCDCDGFRADSRGPEPMLDRP